MMQYAAYNRKWKQLSSQLCLIEYCRTGQEHNDSTMITVNIEIMIEIFVQYENFRIVERCGRKWHSLFLPGRKSAVTALPKCGIMWFFRHRFHQQERKCFLSAKNDWQRQTGWKIFVYSSFHRKGSVSPACRLPDMARKFSVFSCQSLQIPLQ